MSPNRLKLKLEIEHSQECWQCAYQAMDEWLNDGKLQSSTYEFDVPSGNCSVRIAPGLRALNVTARFA